MSKETFTDKISAECTGLDPDKHKNLKTAASFPVLHGDVITVTCKPGYVKKQGDVQITCLEGTEFSTLPQLTCTGARLD